MRMINIYILGIATFASSLLCVWLVKHIAYRLNLVSTPKADRWHKKPTALFGGIGIFIPFVAATMYALIKTESWPFFKPLLMGATGVFILGLVDDIINLKPAIKLVYQIMITSLPITAGLVFNITPWHLVNVIITFFWFVGIMNAINIIDNMDGLSSGVVIISTATVLTILVSSKNFSYQNMFFLVSLVFLCATLGFWMFNRYPASIFMGDAGSLFLGFILAAITMPSKQNSYLGTSSAIMTLVLPLTILAIPIFDTTLVTIMRKLSGKPVSLGGKDHSSHRLVGLGFSEKTTVLILYGLGLTGGVIAVVMKVYAEYIMFLSALYVVFLFFVGIYLGRVKVYQEPSEIEPKNQWTPLISNLLYKRRAGELVLDMVLIPISYYLAFYLRYDGNLGDGAIFYVDTLPIVIPSYVLGFFLAGVYRPIWSLISLSEIIYYFGGVFIGTAISITAFVFFYGFTNFSKSTYFIFTILLFILVAASRFSFRILDVVVRKGRSTGDKQHILIYGAGQAGKILIDECARNINYKNYDPIGFIDDDKFKHNRIISGVKVYNADKLKNNPKKIHHLNISEIWVSSIQIPDEQVFSLITLIEQTQVNKIRIRRFKLFVEEVNVEV